jgi:uncharacterized zinc-type alcohol dehydrogenase-like protein
MSSVPGYAAKDATSPLVPFTINRRDVGPKDVQIDILYCGVCHSDLHRVYNDWNDTVYPVVPGHEIIGRVTEIGTEVAKYKKGDIVGVGVIIDSCQNCDACNEGLENYCEKGPIGTYNAKDRASGEITYGGYSKNIVVTERFVVKIPEGMDLKAVAPLLCAGITTYSPLKHWKVKPGQKIGIVGVGGLGHVAIKTAAAMGAHVVAITTSSAKTKEAIRLGAAEVVISKDIAAMQQHTASFDFILSTVPNSHDINPYLDLLKTNATLVLPGLLGILNAGINGRLLAKRRRSVAGSYIGGMKETQEMLNFCAKHNIVSEIELIKIEDINKAFERLKKGDVKYRFVIDLASLK